MNRLLTILLLAAVALPGFAQEQSEEEKARQAAEQRAERSMRAYSRLDLSDAQKEQLKKILVEDELASSKRRDARRDKVRAILTPDQKESFDQMVNRGGGRDRGGRDRGGRGGGGMMGRMGMGADQLKERLKLTDEQVKKAEEIMGSVREQAMEEFRKMREGGGGMDFGKMREVFGKIRKDSQAKIEKILTDEQKAEFQKMSKEMDERMAQFGMGRQRGPRGEGGGRERGPRRTANPEDMIKRRVDQAMGALALDGEEAAVIKPLVEKLVSYQVTGANKLRQLRDGIGKLEEEAAIKGKMAEYTKAREEYRAKVALLSNGLRELVTVQQEAKLFSLRIFDIAEGSAVTGE